MVRDYGQNLVTEISTNGRIIDVSPNCMELCGYQPKELIGRNVAALVHPDDLARIALDFYQVAKDKGLIQIRFRKKHKSGEWRWMEGAGSVYLTATGEPHCVFILRDITQWAKVAEELGKTEKMESLEEKACGIGHDLKNILGIIWGNILLAKLAANSESKEKFGSIEKVFEKVKSLSDQILSFAQAPKTEKQLIDLTAVIRKSASLTLLNENFDFHVGTSLWPIEAVQQQLNQVFVNLFINAKEAMTEGGVIQVWLENDLERTIERFARPEGKYVRIVVKDTGSGIPDEYLPRLFNPFFTTKPGKKGLGLTTVYSIIKNHGGYIFASSEGGAAFYIYLPVVEDLIG
ncbi:MAG TPA: hypothetical protein DEB05_00385 [Firmicutes bacterium]|jgi:PAS domain S-box-containing protein|nr:hypothetical protein [Bacillota bacterium]HBT15393.1 hypothetical protein [Bacillota bacterium]